MRFVFGSCTKIQNVPTQPVWGEVQALKPDLVLLLGDNIYLDHRYRRARETADLDADLRRQYAAQLGNLTSLHFWPT